MLGVVFWSFTIALVPLALDLAWRLISGVGHWVGRGLSRAFDGVEPWGPPRPLRFDPPSGSFWLDGKTPWPGAGWPGVPDRRGRHRS